MFHLYSLSRPVTRQASSKLLSRCIYTCLFLAVLTQSGIAQTVDDSELPQEAFTLPVQQALPFSAQVVRGELDNGLRYYIQENSEPANRAELRLVVNVGSLAEDDDQLGVAHFLEHMAFNGTRNFAKQELVSFMESIGMRLGPGINASTTSSETIYKLQLPLDKPDNLKKAFLIMQDWASGMTLDSAEIEMERGVVIEEWRRQQGAQNRIRQQQLPVIFNNSRHVVRQPIGTLESLQSFDHDALRRFYRDWYRPDLMAVIAVGDFNAEEIESLLINSFSGIPAAKNPRPLPEAPILPHEDTRVAIATDAEISSTSLSVIFKKPQQRRFDLAEYRQNIVEGLFLSILRPRFQEQAREQNAPFISGMFSPSRLDRDNIAYVMNASVKEDSIMRGMQALITEVERMSRYGPSEAELERHKTSRIKQTEQAYLNRHNQPSPSLVNALVQEYLNGSPMLDIPFAFALQKRFVPEITTEEIRSVAGDWLADTSKVITLVAPEKAGITLPGSEELLTALEHTTNSVIAPRDDEGEERELLASVPEGSPVVSSRKLPLDIHEWTLGNGVKVVLKQTDFLENQFNFIGSSQGGTSLTDDDSYIPAQTAATLIYNSGVDDFTSTQLSRLLTGKLASVYVSINEFNENVFGSGSNVDLETLFQLIYLRMTAPRSDNSVYQNFLDNNRDRLANRDTLPSTVFNDTYTRLLYQDHPRRQPFTVDTLELTDLQQSLDFYRQRFADAGDFVFIFVGDISPEQLLPLAQTYLGALPSSGQQETFRDLGIRPARGVIRQNVYSGREPSSSTNITFTGEINADDPYERARLWLAADTFQERLRNLIREELGATYSVSVSASSNWWPYQNYSLTIAFNSDPERADELQQVVFSELEKFKSQGPSQQELADAIEARLKNHEVSLENNSYWLSYISQAYTYNTEAGVEAIQLYPDTLTANDTEAVRRSAEKFFDTDNYLQLTLLPENFSPEVRPGG